MSTPDPASRATVARLMREIEDQVRQQRRTRLLARGGPEEYRDAETFAIVEDILLRAVDQRDLNALLIPELIDADDREPTGRQAIDRRTLTIGAIAVLIGAASKVDVQLRDPSAMVTRVVELTGLSRVLPIEP